MEIDTKINGLGLFSILSINREDLDSYFSQEPLISIWSYQKFILLPIKPAVFTCFYSYIQELERRREELEQLLLLERV